MASIVGLFIKPGSSMPMARPSDGRLELRAGYGIVDDFNANSLSPRQVLVTRSEDLRDFDIEAGDLRENIVMTGIDAGSFVPGASLEIGEGAIRLTFHCEPCKRVSHLVPSLKVILNRRGLLGVVVSGGFVTTGDDVTIRPNEYPALSESPFDRFCGFIAQVPAGRVVSYRHVTAGMGVASSYMRAIPRYVSQSVSGTVHRVVDSEGGLIESYVPDQLGKLVAEGVEVGLRAACSRRVGEASLILSGTAGTTFPCTCAEPRPGQERPPGGRLTLPDRRFTTLTTDDLVPRPPLALANYVNETLYPWRGPSSPAARRSSSRTSSSVGAAKSSYQAPTA